MPKVTAKFQVTIPLDVRRDLNIVPGTEVDIAREGQRYVLIVDPIQTIKEKWRGKFKDGTPVALRAPSVPPPPPSPPQGLHLRKREKWS